MTTRNPRSRVKRVDFSPDYLSLLGSKTLDRTVSPGPSHTSWYSPSVSYPTLNTDCESEVARERVRTGDRSGGTGRRSTPPPVVFLS